MSMSKAKQLTLFDCGGTYRSIKQKYIVGKSTNKSSGDDTCIAGTSLEVEVNLVKHLRLTTTLDSLVAFRKFLYSCQPAYNTL